MWIVMFYCYTMQLYRMWHFLHNIFKMMLWSDVKIAILVRIVHMMSMVFGSGSGSVGQYLFT
jgi:hypothetical protein